METVFDHNVTDKEWENIRGCDKDSYVKEANNDILYKDIALLYFLRRDMKKVKSYANKIENNLTRMDFWRLVSHPIITSKN